MSIEPSPGQRIAAALRRSPIYVDPSLAAAVPPAKRSVLLARMRASPIPIFVVIVPMVKGGTWDDSEQLTTVVQDRLGRDGAYLTLDQSGRRLYARQWGGTADSQENTADAARVPGFQPDMEEATLADRLIRAVELISAGRGSAEYEAATAYLRRPPTAARRSAGPAPGAGGADEANEGDGSVALPLTAAGLGVAALAVLAVWHRRRVARVRRLEHPLLLPRTALAVAGRATEEQLREQAGREVVAFGETLDRTDVDTSQPRARELMTRALDAYQAAGKVLDAAGGVPDLAGVLVLVDQGRDALASAQSVAGGGKEIPPGPLCFFNPLHGDATVAVAWRPLGSRERLRIRGCQDCAKAVKDHRVPEILTERVDGRQVPYFEVDPDRSVWAETGYGQLRSDLVQRVLRGDLRR